MDGTSFTARWERYARARGLPTDPRSLMPPTTVGQARLDALEFFRLGIVRHGATVRSLQELARDPQQSLF